MTDQTETNKKPAEVVAKLARDVIDEVLQEEGIREEQRSHLKSLLELRHLVGAVTTFQNKALFESDEKLRERLKEFFREHVRKLKGDDTQ